MIEKDYDTFTNLFQHEGWSFLRDDHHPYDDDYSFINHDTCPMGVHIRPEGSVMHYADYRCQQCHQTPPDEIVAVYVLYKWSREEEFGVFDDGTIE